MKKKKYLVVSNSFFPANTPRANRTTELAKELCRQGHAVTVMAPQYSVNNKLAEKYGMKMVDLGERFFPEIPTKFRGRSNFALRALRRGLLIGLNYPTVELTWRIKKKLREQERHDVLISIAAPHSVHWGVARAFGKKKRPADVWLADCGDPFMGQENDSFKPAFYFKYAEKAFCRRADAIAIPVEGARKAYYTEFRNKIHVIPQGFRFADYEHLRSIQPTDDGIVRFAYAGLFIPGRRDPVKFLKEIVKRNDSFEFHVFTKDAALVEPFSRKDSRIIMRGFMPREELLKELSRMNFVVNFENVGERQTPSKLIDYWLCNKPILNIKANEIDVNLLDQFFDANFQNSLNIENPERYEIGNVVRKFDQLADSVLASRVAVEQSI